jgi:hypothetical protein
LDNISRPGKEHLRGAAIKPIGQTQANVITDGVVMTNYLYNAHGQAVGFWKGRYVYAMNGTPVGQLNGTHVHKLTGQYIGELYKDMVVDQHFGNLGNIGNPGNPGNPGHPGNPGNRGAVNYGYPEVFQKLVNQD